MNKSVNVVVVTYGNRWVYLNGLLAFLEAEPLVRKVIVIDNASSYDVAIACEQASFSKAQVFRNEANLGSAGGFSRGISIACESCEELILLLDDDNLPQINTIKKMLNTYAELVGSVKEELLMVIGFRECQHGEFKIPTKLPFKLWHDFLNFNIFNAIQRHCSLIKFVPMKSGADYANYSHGNAYSGLLFSPNLIKAVGLPNADFFLYFDDVEFTMRVLSRNGLLWLDKDSPIDDVEKNYSVSVFKLPILGFTHSISCSKVYYIIRNRAFIDNFIETRSSIYYKINKFVFLLIVAMVCVLTFKYKRLKTIFHAVYDASKGKLGLNPHYTI